MRQHFHAVEENCGLTGTQTWMLREVQRHPGIGISELAGLLGIHQSTCSIMVDKLAVHDFLAKTRDPADRRRVGLAVSAKGNQTLKHLPGPAEGVLPEALKTLTEPDLAGLQQHLDRLIQRLTGAQESYGNLPLAGMFGKDSTIQKEPT
ncbi:MAG: winged helix-turn-helix transcriptional regulator [Zoogloeaceae bacterium]|nr:winged helix-turn-helix transcriptional regulator [Zoogloeaceae bacterium]